MIYTVDYIADAGYRAQMEIVAPSVEVAWGIVDENYGHLEVENVSLVEGCESDDENGNGSDVEYEETDFAEAAKRVLDKRARERLARFEIMTLESMRLYN